MQININDIRGKMIVKKLKYIYFSEQLPLEIEAIISEVGGQINQLVINRFVYLAIKTDQLDHYASTYELIRLIRMFHSNIGPAPIYLDTH